MAASRLRHTPLTREQLYDIYDRATCAVYDAMDAEPNEQQSSQLEAMYLRLSEMREAYDGLGG
jgi:hypothetical protein